MAPRELLLLCSLGLAACGRGGVAGTAPDTLRYAMRSVAKTDGACRTADSSHAAAPCVTLDVTWPELADSTGPNAAPRDFIRRLAAASFRDGGDLGAADSVAVEALAGHAEMRAKHAGYEVPWVMQRAITVACNQPGAFGLKVHTNLFTGGLHPTVVTRFWNFDTRTGARTSGTELVATGEEHAFRESTLRLVERAERRPEVPQLKMPVDSFPLPSSALACGDSLTLQYDALVLGPHRQMDKIVTVPRDSVRGLARR